MLNKKQIGLFTKTEDEVAPEGKAGELMAVDFRYHYDTESKKLTDLLEGVTLTVHFPAFGHEKLGVKISSDDVTLSEVKSLKARCDQGEEIPVRFTDLKVALYAIPTDKGGVNIGITASAKGVRELGFEED